MKLFIHNDLPTTLSTGKVTNEKRELLNSLEKALLANPHVYLINPEQGIRNLTSNITEQYDETLAIGTAGSAIAEKLHAYKGVFPKIRTLSIERREITEGKWRIVNIGKKTIEEQLQGLRGKKIAIIDDTIYSGLTLQELSPYLQHFQKEHIHIFSLIAIAESVEKLSQWSTVFSYVTLPGKREKDVSIIKASGLFQPGAIRTEKNEFLAFFHRPAWLHRWFPKNAKEVYLLCRLLHDIDQKKKSIEMPRMPLFQSALSFFRTPIRAEIIS